MSIFGWSSIIDFEVPSSCKDKVLDIPYMEQFVRYLIDHIDMKIHSYIDQHGVFTRGLLIDKWAGEDASHTYGISCIVFLTTSSLSLHTTNDGRILMDLFSCKPYDEDDVKEFIFNHWGNVKYKSFVKFTR